MKFIFAGASTDDCLLAIREICASRPEIFCPPALNLVVEQLSALSNFETAEIFLREYGINKEDCYSIFRQLISKVLMSKIPVGCHKTIETSYQNYMFYPKLYQLFPEAEFIFFLRDGRDVVASELKSKNELNPEAIQTEEVRDCAIKWLNSIGTGLNGIVEIKSLGASTNIIKYEDLCNPSLNKSIIPSISNSKENIAVDSDLKQHTNQWRTVFNQEHIKVLRDELDEVLEQMGYLKNSPW